MIPAANSLEWLIMVVVAGFLEYFEMFIVVSCYEWVTLMDWVQKLVTVKRIVVKLTMDGSVQVGAGSIDILPRSFEN